MEKPFQQLQRYGKMGHREKQNTTKLGLVHHLRKMTKETNLSYKDHASEIVHRISKADCLSA